MCFVGLLKLIFTLNSIYAIPQTQLADNDNYNPDLSGVKQPKPPALSAKTPNATTLNPIFITTTTIWPKTLLLPAAGAQKWMVEASYLNKNSLQKRQQQQLHEHHLRQEELPTSTSSTPTSPQQRHNKNDQYTFVNKHAPCDYSGYAATSSIVNENINANNGIGEGIGIITTDIDINMSSIFEKSPQIAATAKGYKPLVSSTSNSVNSAENNGPGSSNGSIGTFSSSSTIPTMTATVSTTTKTTTARTTAFNVARNGFRDKINISNQRNEFSNADDDESNYNGSGRFDDAVVVAKIQHQHQHHHHHQQQQQQQQSMQLSQKLRQRRSLNIPTTPTTWEASNLASSSSFFERAELLESNLSPDEHHELLLHRRKRYLVFPEGSSFQLVFDLIIGIVDYTAYAILGITCSVAWELPSKPPSEIVENFREKLNEGSFGLPRRNDTIADGKLQYVDANNATQQKDTPAIQQQSVAAAAAAATSTKFANFQNGYETAWKPQYTVSNYYNNKPPPTTTMTMAGGSDSNSKSYYKTAVDTTSLRRDDFTIAGGDNFAAETQRKTLNENEPPTSPPWLKNYVKLNTNTKYYNNKNVWNFADWRQQQQKRLHASSTADGFLDNVSASDNDDYMPDRLDAYQARQPQTNYAGVSQQKDNWWQRNKQRLENKWQQKQQPWAKYTNKHHVGANGDASAWNGYPPKKPITAYAGPYFNNNGRSNAGYGRTGRQRKILTVPPKHRIYPVFGRRRRSIPNEEMPLTPLEVEMERIHFREQLESRQKLFGKIEQIFRTRGHNGTECVLRALCETGQRQHPAQLYHHHHHYQQQQQEHSHPYNRQPHLTNTGQHREPQSFITELLRAIFALPRDIYVVDDARHGSGHSWRKHNAGSSSTAQLDLEFELQRHQKREFESQIPGHYRVAHTYAGNCALRFAGCELSIWEDVVTFDNGFGYSNDADSDAGRRRTFKM